MTTPTNADDTPITFGPVPSRRLGRSLGINNIPPKYCSYSCVYCQVGPTEHREIEPRIFYDPETIRRAVMRHIEAAQRTGEPIDYLTFVPDGEPTLDAGLAETIDLLRPLGIKIAVISNASLVWRDDVRVALGKADWVSLKVDTVDEHRWRQINGPHPDLRLNDILRGIEQFASLHQGELATETMLVANINDGADSVTAVAEFLGRVKPARAYVAIPTRPPAEPATRAPDEETVHRAYQIVKSKVENVEYLIGYEGDAFAFTGDVRQDLLSITAVHPMPEQAVSALLQKAQAEWSVVNRLVAEGKIKQVDFASKRFYVRRFPRPS